MIHLDHAATGLPRCNDALAAASEAASWASPGRGLHSAQAESLRRIDAARRSVAALIEGGGITCFCAGATAALNQAILGVDLPPKCTIAIGPLSHNAARRPVVALGRRVWVMPHDARGLVDIDAARRSWPDDVRMVVITHGCNVTGVVQPIAPICDLARRTGAWVIVDAAQTLGVLPTLDVADAHVVVASGHKGLRALPGIGALLVRAEVPLVPRVWGGTGFDAQADAMPAELPARLEAGTPNLPGIAAMATAAERHRERGWDFATRAQDLRDAIAAADIQAIGGGQLPIVSFRVRGLAPPAVEEMLDRIYAITVRAGLHCAPASHATLGTLPSGTVRVSAGSTTSDADLDTLTRALRDLMAHTEDGENIAFG